MRLRFIIILSLLVVVPTGILTLMASRALSNWEHELQRGLASTAENSIELTNQRMIASLESKLNKVRMTMADCLSRGSRLEYSKRGEPEAEAIKSAALKLIHDMPSVADVYVFMNPWGFLFPPDSSTLPVPNSELGALIAVLRKELTSAKSLTGTILFSYAGNQYCFSLLRDSQGIYAGFRIDEQGLATIITDSTSEIRGKGFVLVPRGLRNNNAGLVITDSLQGPIVSTEEQVEMRKSDGFLLSRSLNKPFDHIKLEALLEDPDGIRKGGIIRARLFRWGIALLAAAVMSGVGLVLLEAGMQVRRARERSDFMMGVSHDLRTPISSIKILSETMLIGNVPDEEKQKKFLGTISSECNHLADMVERVLFFMKQEHGASVYISAPVSIEPLLRSVIESFLERTRDRANVNVDIQADLPTVDGDENALSKVVYNLLDNALKYSSKMSVSANRTDPVAEVFGTSDLSMSTHSEFQRNSATEGVIQIDVAAQAIEKRGSDWVEIIVKDYGVGIGKHELRKVFRKFYRASLETDGKVGGIGLGLALCHDIIRAHKGKIEVSSEKDKGSEFRILLPKAKPLRS